MRVTVSVNKSDIKKGVPNEPLECPVSVAFRRVLKDGISADVGSEGVTFYGGSLGHSYRIKTPATVEDFAVNFDSPKTRHWATPFNFSLQMKRVDAEALLKPKYL
jgi:hypothetical protein